LDFHLELVQLIIQFPPQSLIRGKSITIQKINSNREEKPSGNFEDLYDVNSQTKNIDIQLPNQCLEKGKRIHLEKKKIFITKIDDQKKEETFHLNNNQFTKRDHLQSNSMNIHH
jgi:hypothetical protein